jgi:hypothetical protein
MPGRIVAFRGDRAQAAGIDNNSITAEVRMSVMTVEESFDLS